MINNVQAGYVWLEDKRTPDFPVVWETQAPFTKECSACDSNQRKNYTTRIKTNK